MRTKLYPARATTWAGKPCYLLAKCRVPSLHIGVSIPPTVRPLSILTTSYISGNIGREHQIDRSEAKCKLSDSSWRRPPLLRRSRRRVQRLKRGASIMLIPSQRMLAAKFRRPPLFTFILLRIGNRSSVGMYTDMGPSWRASQPQHPPPQFQFVINVVTAASSKLVPRLGLWDLSDAADRG
jgi:hypothetical protein